ncbi:DinB family protein [Deinococcus sonorensis]|uniref:DinB family protein n=2 Tax=Deinococcus sonorensis TaxID=309891 RepID=A0AAU7UDF5_9DEIO
MNAPVTQEQTGQALAAIRDELRALAGTLPSEQFFRGSGERWSVAHHLDHLVRSNQPVASALTLPKDRLLPWTGAPRSFTEVQTLYRAALGGGAKASGRFLPDPQGTQQELLDRYASSIEQLTHGLTGWAGPDLDRFALPHPVLGPLSVREMLFFTVYHNQHHLQGIRARLETA